MSIYNLPNNTTGLDGLVTQMTTGNFHWFVPIILFFVWIVVFLGGITRQKAKTGRADYSGWCIISSCLLYTSPSPRDLSTSRMPSSA